MKQTKRSIKVLNFFIKLISIDFEALPVPAYSPVSPLVLPFPPVPTLDVPILASVPRSYAVAKAYATVIKSDSISPIEATLLPMILFSWHAGYIVIACP